MPLTVNFSNNSGFQDSEVSIGFVGSPLEITYGSPLTSVKPLNVNERSQYPFPGNWYTLPELAGGVAINSFSGRVYVAIGTTWSVRLKGYEPGQAVNDHNFYLRYDKMEMTFTGQPADVANLTSIDYWSIPLTLTTYDRNGRLAQTVRGLVGNTTTQDILNALKKLTIPPASRLPDALPALVPGEFPKKYPPAEGTPFPGKFARIIGPSSYPPFSRPCDAPINWQPGPPVTPYDTFQKYLEYLLNRFGPGRKDDHVPILGNGVVAIIKGHFAGVGNPPPHGPEAQQDYNLVAKIDESCNITLIGTLSKTTPANTETRILLKNSDLINPSGIYGANVLYFLNGSNKCTNPKNDVYGWVAGDLLSGLNIGAVGSTVTVSAPKIVPPAMVGSLPSEKWFHIPIDCLFGGLMMNPDAKHYNQWAAALTGASHRSPLKPLSQAYNFAYTDRFEEMKVFASLNPKNVASMMVTIEPSDEGR